MLYPSKPVRVHKLDLIRRQDPQIWKIQYKWNGHRAVINTGEPDCIFSRHGTPLTSAAKTGFSTECMKIFGLDCVLDGEFMPPSMSGEKEPFIVLYDIPVWRGKDLTQNNYLTRLAILAKHWTDFKKPGRIRVKSGIWITETMSLASLDAALEQCDRKLMEGIVAKNIASNLSWSRIAQMESISQLKYRL